MNRQFVWRSWLIVILLLCTLAACQPGDGAAGEQADDPAADDLGGGDLDALPGAEIPAEAPVQEPGGVLGSNLLASFQADAAGNTDYPSYYAGCYVDDDARLVVLMADDTPENRQDIYRRAGDREGIVFAAAEYAMNELTAVMDVIYQKVTEDGAKIPVFYEWAVLDSENRIVVWLQDCGEEEIARFRRTVSDFEGIRFEQAQGIPVLDDLEE